MRGELENLYRAKLVERPNGKPCNIIGTLGVFAYGLSEHMGEMCFFKPDDPVLLGNHPKLRPMPGCAETSGAVLSFTVQQTGDVYVWHVGRMLNDPNAIDEFLEFATSHDRTIRRLLEKGAARHLERLVSVVGARKVAPLFFAQEQKLYHELVTAFGVIGLLGILLGKLAI